MKNARLSLQILSCLPLLIAVTTFFALPAETAAAKAKTSVLLSDADRDREALYGSPEKKRYRHNWFNCIKRYQRIYTVYPGSEEAVWALYHTGRLYCGLYKYSGMAKDLEEAVGLYRKLVDNYPNHRLADDGQYLIGEIYYNQLKDLSQAYVEFLKVEVKFPGGDMVPKARARLKSLTAALNRKNEEQAGKSGPRSGLVAVEGIRHWSTANYTRVVIDLQDSVDYKHHLLKPDPDINKPRRLYLDLKNARVTRQIDSQLEIRDGLLRLARAGQYTPDTVRVVLDMETIGGYNVFRLHDPFRIVVDVKRAGSGGKEPVPASTAKIRKQPVRRGVRKAEGPDNGFSLAQQLGLNVRRIVIDPGHGGKDPGCLSKSGVREKDVVLELSRVLGNKLKKELGCEISYTRTRDVFLGLEERTAYANTKNADLFISLHINAHRSSKVWGLETYFLNMATDEQSVAVAARENATSAKNISDLQTILESLMLNTKIHESNRLAHEVQKGMLSHVETRYDLTRSLGVKQAPFYVLIGAEMPAILIETGFITNPMEQKRLASQIYRECIADGIVKGIKAYVKGIDQVYQGG